MVADAFGAAAAVMGADAPWVIAPEMRFLSGDEMRDGWHQAEAAVRRRLAVSQGFPIRYLLCPVTSACLRDLPRERSAFLQRDLLYLDQDIRRPSERLKEVVI